MVSLDTCKMVCVFCSFFLLYDSVQILHAQEKYSSRDGLGCWYSPITAVRNCCFFFFFFLVEGGEYGLLLSQGECGTSCDRHVSSSSKWK